MALWGKKSYKQNDSISRLLSAYRSENISVMSELKNFLSLLETLKSLGDFEKKEVLGFLTRRVGAFNPWGAGGFVDVGSLFDAMSTNQERLVNIINDLIKVLEEENVELSKHLGNLEPNQIQLDTQLQNLLVKYNQRESGLVQELSTLLTSVNKLGHEVIGIGEESVKETSKIYDNYYIELENLVKSKVSSFGEWFGALGRVIINLETIITKLKTLKRDSIEEFLGHLHLTTEPQKNSYKFAENFYRANRGIEIVKTFNELNSKLNNKSYSNLEDVELKKKIEDFVKTTVVKLFEGTDSFKAGFKVKEDEDKIKELVKVFKELYNNLATKVAGDEDYSSIYGSGEIMRLNITVMGRKLQLKSFFDKYVTSSGEEKRKENLESAIEYVRILLTSENDEAFKGYMEEQSKDSTSGIRPKGSGGGRTDKVFAGGKEFKKDEVLENFRSLQEELIEQLSLIVRYFNDDDDNLREGAQGEFNSAKREILEILKTFGINLKAYKNHQSMSEDSYQQKLLMLKSIVERWDKITSSEKKDVNDLVDSTNQFVNIL